MDIHINEIEKRVQKETHNNGQEILHKGAEVTQ